MTSPIDRIRLRRRFAGINVAAQMQAHGATPAEIEASLGATPNHVRHLLASIERAERPGMKLPSNQETSK